MLLLCTCNKWLKRFILVRLLSFSSIILLFFIWSSVFIFFYSLFSSDLFFFSFVLFIFLVYYVLFSLLLILLTGPSSPVRNASANVVLSSPSQMSSPSANQNFTSVSIPQNNNNVNPHFISSSPPVTISSSSCAKCNSPYCVGVC